MSDIVRSEEYKGYQIDIVQDYDATNPFEDWDCEPPIAVYYDGDIKAYSGYKGKYGDVTDPPTLTRKQILDNLADIIDLTDSDSVWDLTTKFYHTTRGHYTKGALMLATPVEDCINDSIYEYMQNGCSNSDKLDKLERLYEMAEIPCVLKSTTGYVQGCYAEVLAVATPQWIKEVGAPLKGVEKQLEYAVKLYGYWAWGDVYGYDIPDLGESCFGYYGDAEDSGLMEAAQSQINYEIEQQKEAIEADRKRHFNQVKKWIRGHVPFIYRKPLEV